MPPKHWNKGYGRVLAKSYLYYAPKLGYQGSVFNLVYVNNAASIRYVDYTTFSVCILPIFLVTSPPSPRLWEALGFMKAGLIPNAGRLKKEGGGEEYVDALVFYKSFVDHQP